MSFLPPRVSKQFAKRKIISGKVILTMVNNRDNVAASTAVLRNMKV